MPILKRVQMAFKNLTAMTFGRFAPRWKSLWLGGGTRFDYAREVNPVANSIVLAVVGWVCRTFPEAPPRVSIRNRQGELTAVPDHALIQLLRRPNPFYSGIVLWMATLGSWILDGNAYWIKVRSDANRVVQLWWVPPGMMEPGFPTDGSVFISHYEYKPDGRAKPIEYAVTDIVHFRDGLDPDNPRKGFSRMKSLLREIFTDDQAATFTGTILRNLGVPGVLISPDADDRDISPDEAEKVKSDFKQRFGGDNRGEPMVLGGKTKVQILSFSPEQMNLEKLRRIPEERVTAVFGIPAIVAGLGAGLDAATYSNYAQAREAAYESHVIPTQRLFAEEIRVQLLVDFADISTTEFDFDLSNVRVLQDDQNKLVERLTKSLLAGGMTLNAYLRHINEPELPASVGDVLYVPKSVLPMKPDQLAQIQPAVPATGTQQVPFSVGAPAPVQTNGKVAVPA